MKRRPSLRIENKAVVRTRRKSRSKPGPQSKGGRPYVVRYCKCGNEACYAVHVVARSVGRGQNRDTRRIKMTEHFLLCNACARKRGTYTGELEESAHGLLGPWAKRPVTPATRGLFED
jgi:hypothetical protein